METQYTRLSLTPSGVSPVIYMSQYDVGRPIGFICDSDLDSYTVTLEATRTDSTAITAAIITDGRIGVFVTTATMTNQADDYPAQVVVTDGDDVRVASMPVRMHVIAAAMDENSEAIEEDASLYQQYTGSVQALIADMRADLNALEDVYVTPQMYGAAGDGATDDTTAIQAAMNAGAGRVIFPAGTYKITASISVPGNTIVDLNGATILATDVDAFAVGGTSNVTIQNGTITQTRIGIRVYNAEYFTLRNITMTLKTQYPATRDLSNAIRLEGAEHFTIEDVTYSAPRTGDGSSDLTDGLHINGNVKHGYVRRFCGTSNDDFIALNSIETIDGYGTGPIDDIVFEQCQTCGGDNDSTFCAVRIYNWGAQRLISNVTFKDCDFGADATACIRFVNSEDGRGDASKDYCYAKNIIFERCRIRSYLTDGVTYPIQCAHAHVDGLIFLDCELDDENSTGILNAYYASVLTGLVFEGLRNMSDHFGSVAINLNGSSVDGFVLMGCDLDNSNSSTTVPLIQVSGASGRITVKDCKIKHFYSLVSVLTNIVDAITIDNVDAYENSYGVVVFSGGASVIRLCDYTEHDNTNYAVNVRAGVTNPTAVYATNVDATLVNQTYFAELTYARFVGTKSSQVPGAPVIGDRYTQTSSATFVGEKVYSGTEWVAL